MAVPQAIATFTRLGHDVALPITESAAYDLIVDCEERLKRVQVRYTSCERGQVDLRRIHSNGSGYVVLNERGEEFLLKECLHARRSWRTDHASLLADANRTRFPTLAVAGRGALRAKKPVSRLSRALARSQTTGVEPPKTSS